MIATVGDADGRPIFRLHAVTAGFGDRLFGYFFRLFYVLTEIYPLVPFPPSVCEGVSDYTRTSLRWTPGTSARAQEHRNVLPELILFTTAHRTLQPSVFVACVDHVAGAESTQGFYWSESTPEANGVMYPGS